MPQGWNRKLVSYGVARGLVWRIKQSRLACDSGLVLRIAQSHLAFHPKSVKVRTNFKQCGNARTAFPVSFGVTTVTQLQST